MRLSINLKNIDPVSHSKKICWYVKPTLSRAGQGGEVNKHSRT